MAVSPEETRFASAERATEQEIQAQRRLLTGENLVRELLDAFPERTLVLNDERQILMANEAMFADMSLADDSPLLGLRPGEAINCEHVQDGPNGCGTSEYCRTCGALRAILVAREKGRAVHECRISTRSRGLEGSLDLLVSAREVNVRGNGFTMLTLTDISHEKRRRILERIFFHDILNTVAALKGFAQLMNVSEGAEAGRLPRTILDVSEGLINEIEVHKELMEAENNELLVQPRPLDSLSYLNMAAKKLQPSGSPGNSRLVVAPDSGAVEFISDPVLLGRVLSNLVKNAFEACGAAETVTLGCRKLESEEVEFWVHNPGCIPQENQLQLFNRSFSTKGPDRGIGTYSVRLLSERYLGGRVAYESSEKDGTVFRVIYPTHPDFQNQQ